jgi:hypothetical protein
MAEVRVETWAQLIEEVYFEPINETLNRHRSQCVYRGMTDARYGLEPGLMRVGEHFAEVEMILLDDFRKYAHRDAAGGDSFWNWMAVAQHHGLPTRFLDWTFSPYVALHFATSNLGAGPPGGDAVIWAVNYVETNALLSDHLAHTLRMHNKNVFSVDMLAGALADLRALDDFQPEPFVLFLEPPSLDQRIVNQAALFSLMSRPRTRNPAGGSWTALLDEFLVAKQSTIGRTLFKKIVIAADLKWEIRDRLDQANITERVQYPGMDGLSAWLKRHYTKRDGAVLTSPEAKSRNPRLERMQPE